MKFLLSHLVSGAFLKVNKLKSLRTTQSIPEENFDG